MLRRAVMVGLAVLAPNGALAAPSGEAPGADQAPSLGPPPGSRDEPLPWRNTLLGWGTTAAATTLGLGGNYQSANPTLETSLWFRPRYYVHEGERDAIYASARIDVVRELTNSDVTTRRGETTLSDATLLAAYRRVLVDQGGYETGLAVSLPVLTFPTSKFSYYSGTILGVGTSVRLSQELPLAGARAAAFRNLELGVSAGYTHTFTEAEQPTNPELRRLRMDPDGYTVASDQLSFAASAAHETVVAGTLDLEVLERLSWGAGLSYRPTWKYGFDDVELCGGVATGCEPVRRRADRTTLVVVTGFETTLEYRILDALGLGLAYRNVAGRIAPDGQRRNPFYSPAATLSLELVAHLDAVYLSATGRSSEPATRRP